jgi:hypothetical protein
MMKNKLVPVVPPAPHLAVRGELIEVIPKPELDPHPHEQDKLEVLHRRVTTQTPVAILIIVRKKDRILPLRDRVQ